MTTTTTIRLTSLHPVRSIAALLGMSAMLLSCQTDRTRDPMPMQSTSPTKTCTVQDFVAPGGATPSHTCTVSVTLSRKLVSIGRIVLCYVRVQIQMSCAGQPPFGGCKQSKIITVGCGENGEVSAILCGGEEVKVKPKDPDGPDGPLPPPTWGSLVGADCGRLEITVPHPF